MINVTAHFPDGTNNVHNLLDGTTVLDLKNTVSVDGNSPAAFQGQHAANLIVSTGGGGALDDGTTLADGTVYDLTLVQADGEEGGQADDDNDDSGDDRDYDADHSGYRAPPNSPRGGGRNGGANGLGDGGYGGYGGDGYAVYVYVSNIGAGPWEYNLEAGSTAAALKEKIVADSNSPLASVAASELAVYDGSNWLSDNDPVANGAAYTVQQVR